MVAGQPKLQGRAVVGVIGRAGFVPLLEESSRSFIGQGSGKWEGGIADRSRGAVRSGDSRHQDAGNAWVFFAGKSEHLLPGSARGCRLWVHGDGRDRQLRIQWVRRQTNGAGKATGCGRSNSETELQLRFTIGSSNAILSHRNPLTVLR